MQFLFRNSHYRGAGSSTNLSLGLICVSCSLAEELQNDKLLTTCIECSQEARVMACHGELVRCPWNITSIWTPDLRFRPSGWRAREIGPCAREWSFFWDSFEGVFSVLHMRTSISSFQSAVTVGEPCGVDGVLATSAVTYRVSQEECARLRESVPYVKVCRYNPKHLYPKLNGYGDNGQRSLKIWQLLHTLSDCQIHIKTGRNMWFL